MGTDVPKCQIRISLAEQQYYSSEASHNKANEANFNVYEESVLPVVEAGLTQTISPEGGNFSIFSHSFRRPATVSAKCPSVLKLVEKKLYLAPM